MRQRKPMLPSMAELICGNIDFCLLEPLLQNHKHTNTISNVETDYCMPYSSHLIVTGRLSFVDEVVSVMFSCFMAA